MVSMLTGMSSIAAPTSIPTPLEDAGREPDRGRLGVPLVVLTAGASTFAALACFVFVGGPPPWDASIERALHARSVGVWGTVTLLGSFPLLASITVAVVLVLAARRRFNDAAFMALVVATEPLVNSLAKGAFGRARPLWPDPAVTAAGYAFPSGHTMAATVTWGALAVVMARTQHGPQRCTLIGLTASLAIVVGVSRVALGVHWPSDVLAGWLLGLAWLAAVMLMVRAPAPRRAIAAKQTVRAIARRRPR